MADEAPLYALEKMPRREASAAITMRMFTPRQRMELGIRNPMGDDRNGEVRFTIGMYHLTRTVIIVLGADDLYHIEIGKNVKRRGNPLPVWRTDAVSEQGVYGDMLGEVLIRMWCDYCEKNP